MDANNLMVDSYLQMVIGIPIMQRDYFSWCIQVIVSHRVWRVSLELSFLPCFKCLVWSMELLTVMLLSSTKHSAHDCSSTGFTSFNYLLCMTSPSSSGSIVVY